MEPGEFTVGTEYDTLSTNDELQAPFILRFDNMEV